MNIFEETDYKRVLKHLMAVREKGQRGISRRLADHLGVNPSLVSQVMTGDKDFTEEQIVGISEFFGLAGLETRYLLVLVQSARTGSEQLKALYREQLAELRKTALDLASRVPGERTLTDDELATFHSSWVYPSIQLLTTLNKKPTLKDICERFRLSQTEAQKFVDFLLEVGMIVREKNTFGPGSSLTHLRKGSPAIVSFRRNWRIKALDVADKIQDDEMMYSCSFSVSRADFARIREEFVRSIQRFLDVTQESPAEDIAQLNIDLFWLRS